MFKMPREDRELLAPLVGMDPRYLYQCLEERSDKGLAPHKAMELERASKGKYRCEQLLPKLAWHRKRDPSWPWHPRGRPLPDLLSQEA